MVLVTETLCHYITDKYISAYLHWQREGERGKGIELDALVTAHLARHLRLELPVEQVHHHGAVPRQVVLPVLTRHDDYWHKFELINNEVNLIVRLLPSGRPSLSLSST